LSSSDGGGLYVTGDSLPTLNNTIIWVNTATGNGNQVYIHGTDLTVILNYCDYANGSGDLAGSGTATPDSCINDSPQFVDAAGGNYRLSGTSLCVGAGSNGLVPLGVTTDLDGNARIADGVVDMGAYEYQP
jgi:hypothetical protein